MEENPGREETEESRLKNLAVKQRAFDEETLRIENEIKQRAEELAGQRLKLEEEFRKTKFHEVDAERRREEDMLTSKAESFLKVLRAERIKKEEARRRAEEESRKRAEEERRRREEEELRRRQEEERKRREEEERRRAEEDRRRKEEDARRKAEEERRRQEEARRRQEEERRKKEEEAKQKAEEERQRQEEERRKKEEALRREEEERRQREEEVRQKEEERIRLEEEKRKREEDDRRRREEEIRRKEEELHRVEEERRERIISLIASAEVYFANDDYENALVEVAKALVNDPTNAEALALEQRIREAQGTGVETEGEEVQAEEVPTAGCPRVARVGFGGIRKEKEPTSRAKILTIGIIAVAIIGILIFQLRKSLFHEDVTLGVMPFLSASNSVEEAVTGVSLAEEVSRKFENFKSISSMSYSSTYGLARFTNNSTRSIFNLGYLYVLQGSVRKDDEIYTIDVKLVDSLGDVAWSHSYRGALGNLASITIDIVRQVIKTTDAGEDAVGTASLASPITENSSAYTFYLRGLELLHRRTSESAQNAALLFQQALDEDKRFAEAAAGVAAAQLMKIDLSQGLNDTALTAANRYAMIAISINPNLSEGHLALARVLAANGKYQSALIECDSALAQSPGKSDIYFQKSKFDLEIGDYERGSTMAARAYELNPRDPWVLRQIAGLEFFKGSVREGMSYLEKSLVFVNDSNDVVIGPMADALLYDADLLLTHGGRVGMACERRLATNPNDYETIYRLARLMQVNGNGLEAIKMLDRNTKLLQQDLRQYPNDALRMMYLALTLTRLGKYPEAVALAKRAEEISPNNPAVLYKISQMYSIQLVSLKKNQVDTKKQEEALQTLRKAVAVRYLLEEVTSGDFYNLRDLKEYRSAVKSTVR